MRLSSLLKAPALVVALSFASLSCDDGDMPYVPPRDADHRAWVRQVIPVLYGRKARNYHEVELLSHLTASLGRRPVLESMMKSPEYVHHWTDVMVDVLDVERWGYCEKSAAVSGDYPATDGALAEFILNNDGLATYSEPFDLQSVIQSSLHLDHIAPAYLADLYVLQFGEEAPCNQDRLAIGDTFARRFLNRQRDCLACHNADYSKTGPDSGWNRHHTLPDTSLDSAMWNGKTTDLDPIIHYTVFTPGQVKPDPVAFGGLVWDRPWGSMQGVGNVLEFNTAVNWVPEFDNDFFGSTSLNHSAMDALPAIGTVERKLRQGVFALQDGFDYQPNDDVVSLCADCAMCETLSPTPPSPFSSGWAAYAAWAQNTAICDDLANGTVDATGAPFGDQVQALFFGLPGVPADGVCLDCHTWMDDSSTFWVGLRDGNDLNEDGPAAPLSELECRLLDSTGGTDPLDPMSQCGSRMPKYGPYLSASEIQLVQNWLHGLPPADACDAVDCNAIPETQVSDEEAFAFQVAMGFVDEVWTRTMGHALTTPHSFPRNTEQRDILLHLTEDAFLANDWSLQEVLITILDSDYFNRLPPEAIPLDGEPYEVAPVYDPWWMYDPRDPNMDPTPSTVLTEADEILIELAVSDQVNNAMTEGLARYRPTTLVRSVGAALDWPDHESMPDDDPYYPHKDLYYGIGQNMNADATGFNAFELVGLLRWEDTMDCRDRAGVNVDFWIDDLVAAAVADPGVVTYRDLTEALRDRLLSDGTIQTGEPLAFADSSGTQTEEAALEAIFGTSLDNPMGSAWSTETHLKTICGVMLMTPDFLIAGWASEQQGPQPFEEVCPPGEACTRWDICLEYSPYFAGNTGPFGIECDGYVTEIVAPGPDGRGDVPLEGSYDGGASTVCPPGQCGFVAGKASIEDSPEPEPPVCDPRCTGEAQCCGAAAPAFPRPGVHVLWADGSTVEEAEGVTRYVPSAATWEPLQRGERLTYGTVLEVPADGFLSIGAPRDIEDAVPFVYEPPPYDMSEVAPRHLVISGPPVLDRLEERERHTAAVAAQRSQDRHAHDARARVSESLTWGVLDGPPTVDFEALKPEGDRPQVPNDPELQVGEAPPPTRSRR